MVSFSDLKVYRSTSDLGGAITGTEVQPATPNNLFTNIPRSDYVAGTTYYKCVYLKNTHTAESMDNFKIWISGGTPSPNTKLSFAFDPLAVTSISFDGTNDYVDLTNDATLWSQSLTKFSFSLWIYPTAGWDTNFREVVYHSGGTNQGFRCQISDSVANRIFFTIRNAGGTFISSTNDTLQLNQWNFITCVYDNSLGSGNLKVYVNGVVGTNANLTEAINLSATLRLGEATTDFKGNIRDFRWYTTKALTQTEIDDIYDDSPSAPTPDYWLKVTEGTGSPTDFISGTKVGTLTNGAAWSVATAQTIANVNTSPSNVTWYESNDIPESLGRISAGQAFPIWLKLEVTATSTADPILDDEGIFTIEFDIPQGGTGSSGGNNSGTGTYHYEPYGTFNTVSDVVTQNDAAALDLNQFSVACWFRTSYNYTTGEGTLVRKGFGFYQTDADVKNYFIKINNEPYNNQLEAGFEELGGNIHPTYTDGVTWNDGLWHLAIVTYDGNIVSLYVDGVLRHTHNTTATPGTNARKLYIGADPDEPTSSTKRVFHGNIDEVRVWNNDLSAAEVSALFQNGTVPQTSAIVYENLFGGSTGGGGTGGTGGNPPPVNADYKIAIFGDEGCEPETDDMIDLIQTQAYDLAVSVGDHAYESASCWTTRFTPIKSIFKASAMGNHEYSESGGTTPYKTFFGQSNTYYKYKFQNVMFFVIDSNDDQSGVDLDAQVTWLTNELEAIKNDSTVTWRIVVMHSPWFGATSDHTYNEFNQVQKFHALLTSYKVSLVYTGHNHNWQRSKQVAYNSGTPSSPIVVGATSPYSRNTAGLIHIVTGTGGHDSGSGLYALGTQPSWQAYQNRTNNGVHELIASNNGQTLTGQFRNNAGDTFDTFVINA